MYISTIAYSRDLSLAMFAECVPSRRKVNAFSSKKGGRSTCYPGARQDDGYLPVSC